MVTCIVSGDLERRRPCKLLSQKFAGRVVGSRRNLRMDIRVQSRDPVLRKGSAVHLFTTFIPLKKADRSFQHHCLTGFFEILYI